MTFRNIYQILQAAGVSAGDIVLGHDYGDATCYPGTGQPITDLSGTGVVTNRGTTSATESTDPTFVGSAGGLSINDKFTFDGLDLIRAPSVVTALDFIHKDNAKCTLLLGLKRIRSGSVIQVFFESNVGSSSNIGLSLQFNTDDTLRLLVRRGSATNALSENVLTLPAFDGNIIIAVSWDEAVGALGGFMLDSSGGFAQFTSTYTTPSAAAATNPFGVFGSTQASTRPVNGTEGFFAAVVANVVTRAQAQAVLNEAGLRLGIAPEPEAFNSLESGFIAGIPGGGFLEHGMI